MSNIFNKYINSKVYKITNNINNICYVGSTTCTLRQRFSGHKSGYKIWLKNINYNQCMSYILFHNYGLENCTIQELCICNSLSELKEKEAFYIKSLDTINKVVPIINMESCFCNICNKKYASYQSLWNHIKKFHKANKLTNTDNLPGHNYIIPVHNDNIPVYTIIKKSSIPTLQCGYCKKFYKSISTKSFHIKSCKLDHPEIQIVNNTKICNICGKISNCLSSAYNHKKICDQKQITTINNINNNTTNNNNLINNNLINNSNNNNTIIEKSSIPTLQCGYCKKFYKSISTKSFHIKSCKLDHPEIQIVNNTKICNICGKISNCLSSAYNHKKICDQEQITIII